MEMVDLLSRALQSDLENLALVQRCVEAVDKSIILGAPTELMQTHFLQVLMPHIEDYKIFELKDCHISEVGKMLCSGAVASYGHFTTSVGKQS